MGPKRYPVTQNFVDEFPRDNPDGWAHVTAKEELEKELMPPPSCIPLKRKKRRMEASFSSFMAEIAEIKSSPTEIFLHELDTIESMVDEHPPSPQAILQGLGLCKFRDDDVRALLEYPPPRVSPAALRVRRADWRAGALRNEYVVKCLLQL